MSAKRSVVQFLVAMGMVLIGDGLWLGLSMGGFYRDELRGLLRLSESGGFDPRLLPTLLVYLLIPLGVFVFAVRGTRRPFLKGALFGFVLYGTYDFTNWSLLRDWTAAVSLVDLGWGTFICSLSAGVAERIGRRV